MTTVSIIDNKFTSSSQQRYEYSFDYQRKSPDYLFDSSNEKEVIEPFDCEKDALEFANFYSQKVLNEEG